MNIYTPDKCPYKEGDYVIYTVYKNIRFVCKYIAYNPKTDNCQVHVIDINATALSFGTEVIDVPLRDLAPFKSYS